MRLNYDLTAYYIKIKMEKMSSLTGNLPTKKAGMHRVFRLFKMYILFSFPVPPAQTQLAPVPSGFDTYGFLHNAGNRRGFGKSGRWILLHDTVFDAPCRVV